MDNATADNIHPFNETAPPVTALARRSPFEQVRELSQYLKDLDIVCESLCKSTLLPREMQAPANLKLVLLQGMSMGFDIVQSIRASFVIPGSKDGYTPPKVGYYVQSLIALIHSRGKCRYFRVEETTGKRCRVVCARSDEDEGIVHAFELTLETAREANMDKKWSKGQDGKWFAEQKHPWMTAPADMLMWRTCGRAAKAVFPDVVFGMSTPDELEDLVAAEVMDRDTSGGFVSIPNPPPRAAAASSSPPSSTAAAQPATSEIVDAELVDDEAAPATSGDPAWDQLLHEVAQLTNDRDMLEALPPDVIAAWDQRLAAAKTKRDLNALAPWIGAANKRASQSKACAELGAHMARTFNERNAKLRDEARAQTKPAGEP